MKKALILVFKDLARDPRVKRQVVALSKTYDITVLCEGASDLSGVTHLLLPSGKKNFSEKLIAAVRLLSGAFETHYWSDPRVQRAKELVAGQKYDLIVANDLETLPLALSLNGRVLFDAHEFSPREFEDVATWRIFFMEYTEYLCREYLPRVDRMLTVADGIAEAYRDQFGIEPEVVTNAAPLQPLEPSPVGEPIRMLYHGMAVPSRKVETALAVMDHLDDRFTLDLILVPGDEGYIQRLKEKAAGDRRIRFKEPVPVSEIPAMSNAYDIGLFLIEPTNFNYKHCLPNKFFEFIQARLAVAIGPSPEMARLVEQHGLGVVSPDFTPERMAQRLRELSKELIEAYKLNAHTAAPLLSAEENAHRLQRVAEGPELDS